MEHKVFPSPPISFHFDRRSREHKVFPSPPISFFLSIVSADAVDVALEVAVVNQFG